MKMMNKEMIIKTCSCSIMILRTNEVFMEEEVLYGLLLLGMHRLFTTTTIIII